ncbi:MAG: hypothetical protein GX119_07945 [Syntrophomonadaceae bacterium]|nr:hypothetical protein [Syntrophomonadaceae bacterium]
MNYRRIIYIALIMFILIWLWQNMSWDHSQEEMAIMPKDRVMEQMAAHYEEQDRLIIYFPRDYRGMAEEVFYLTVYQGSEIYTDKYRIESLEKESNPQLELSWEDSWKNIQLPVNKFEAYSLEKGEWKLNQ